MTQSHHLRHGNKKSQYLLLKSLDIERNSSRDFIDAQCLNNIQPTNPAEHDDEIQPINTSRPTKTTTINPTQASDPTQKKVAWLEYESQLPVGTHKNSERITGDHESSCKEVNSKIVNDINQLNRNDKERKVV